MNKYKKIEKSIKNELIEIIDKSTENERRRMDEANKAYNNKLNKIFNDPKVKKKMELHSNCINNITNLTLKIQIAFQKAIKEINRQPISDDEKKNKIKNLSNAIEEAIFDNEEKKILSIIKNQLKNLPIQQLRITI